MKRASDAPTPLGGLLEQLVVQQARSREKLADRRRAAEEADDELAELTQQIEELRSLLWAPRLAAVTPGVEAQNGGESGAEEGQKRGESPPPVDHQESPEITAPAPGSLPVDTGSPQKSPGIPGNPRESSEDLGQKSAGLVPNRPDSAGPPADQQPPQQRTSGRPSSGPAHRRDSGIGLRIVDWIRHSGFAWVNASQVAGGMEGDYDRTGAMLAYLATAGKLIRRPTPPGSPGKSLVQYALPEAVSARARAGVSTERREP